MDNSEQIWKFLKDKGLNNYGIAGLMGNLDAESGLKPTNLQDTYNSKLGLSDDEYTRRVDNNTYTNFIHDEAGYGLAQWTWWTRKKSLLEFCKSKNKSIGDLNTQLEFLLQELTTIFPSVLKILKSATSVQQASDAVLMNFEQPANASSQRTKRAQYGQYYYDKFNKGVDITMGTNVYMKGYKTQLSKNLNSTEFDCQGHGCCNQTRINSKLVDYVQQICDHFNRPVTISSGYRCPTHNRAVGGATGSRHSVGDAADIIIQGISPAEVAKYAESIGIKGIGLYETSADGHFVHIDTREQKSFWYGQKQQPRTSFQNSNSSSIVVNQNSSTLLQIGNHGDKVKQLQNDLIALGYSCGSAGADGDFGIGTLNAVKKFQKEHNLEADGIVGPATLSAINSAQKILIGNKNGKVVASLLNVRQNAGLNYPIISRLQSGTKVTIIEEKNGWGKLSNGGWVCLQYIKEI